MYCTHDLHTHSTASDGTLAPAELVRRASTAGILCLGLTDHDTTDGLSEAAHMAQELPIELIPGVEISVTWNGGTVHLVGLRIDPAAPGLTAGLARLREFRDWRAEEIGRRLGKAGIPNAYAGALALSSGKLVGRTHFARFLVRAGVVAEERDVFKRFLTQGKPGHVPGQWAELGDAIGWIRDAGGVPVLAHPARYPFTRGKLRRLLGEFKEGGGIGMEVVSGSHSRDDMFSMTRLAMDFRLLASAGSDYHGPECTWISLGRLPIPPPGPHPLWRDWPLPEFSQRSVA